MRRAFFALILLLTFTLSFSSVTLAAPAHIGASTELAIAKDLEATVSRVNANTGVWSKRPSSALEFGALNFKSGKDASDKEWMLFLPDYYFAIDVSAKNGSLPVDGSIQVTYNEGSNPNAPGHGLGYKATLTYCKTYFASTGDFKNNKTTDSILGKVLIKDGFTVPTSAVRADWLRIYVGIVTLDPKASPADPAGAEVFSPADKAGAYSGGLVITLM